MENETVVTAQRTGRVTGPWIYNVRIGETFTVVRQPFAVESTRYDTVERRLKELYPNATIYVAWDN